VERETGLEPATPTLVASICKVYIRLSETQYRSGEVSGRNSVSDGGLILFAGAGSEEEGGRKKG